ncbi:MAG: hypothetical protein L0I44_12995, partial [Enterococcus sp.]|nr:hypothetical protein [Enterococcus sp.]
YRLQALQREHMTPRRLKKIIRLKRNEQRQHLYFLILLSLMSSCSLGILGIFTLTVQSNYQRIKSEDRQVNEQLATLDKLFQLEKITPDRHLLKEKEWGSLFDKSRSESGKSEIERALSQQARRYFDISDVKVSLDKDNRAVTIRLVGQVDTHKKKEKLKRQIRGFVQSVDGDYELMHVRIHLATLIGEDESVIYSADYTRNKKEEAFKKVNDFERDVRLGEEKG